MYICTLYEYVNIFTIYIQRFSSKSIMQNKKKAKKKKEIDTKTIKA